MRSELVRGGRVQRAMNPIILTSRRLYAGFALTLAAVASAQTTSTNPPPQPDTPGYHEAGPGVTTKEDNIPRHDRMFLEKAAKSGMKEVTVSQAVMPKLTNPAAREFAAMMVKDHTAVNTELKQLAARKAITLPPEDKTEKLAEKWSEKTKNVDKDYLKEMISDHKDAVELLEKGAKSEDADIAAFAKKHLPAIQKHLEMAKAHEAALNP